MSAIREGGARTLASYPAEASFYRRVFRRVRPRHLLVEDGAFGYRAVLNATAREHGITVIDGGCPLMFGPTADFTHKVMRFVFTRNGHVPRTVV